MVLRLRRVGIDLTQHLADGGYGLDIEAHKGNMEFSTLEVAGKNIQKVGQIPVGIAEKVSRRLLFGALGYQLIELLMVAAGFNQSHFRLLSQTGFLMAALLLPLQAGCR